MVHSYELQENEWLFSLYSERSRWVPCFLKTSFWAGMSTTQRSESINAFFDGYVNAKTTLKQFVEQYERALRSKVEKEIQADYKSYSAIVLCATMYELEKQFQAIYTISKFKEFQSQFTGMVYCDIISNEDGSEKFFRGHKHMVQEDVICNGKKYKKIYIVETLKESGNFACSCHLFESRGIICKHAITVLIRNDVTSVPDMRDVCRSYQRVKINYDGWTPDQLRYDHLCRAFAAVADKVANDDMRAGKLIEWIGAVSNDLDSINIDQKSKGKSNLNQSILVDSVKGGADKTLGPKIFYPNHVKRKGAPRKLRQKEALEKISKN
ncbi:FAR1-related protein [Striga asiatica]|uniref:Protein FAR1-RELATED SEQUENCE n=1 Tax=Striga asiatica TaxID=4170 RepID=A0A5A7Q6X7_STRAF|nr:FAR1-related protein [Striga asiatica]